MNRYLKNMVVFLLVSIMAVSCSRQKADIPEEIKNPEPTETSVPVPTDTPEPTQTPEPTLIPTSTPDPDFVGCAENNYTVDEDRSWLLGAGYGAEKLEDVWLLTDNEGNRIKIERIDPTEVGKNTLEINNAIVTVSKGVVLTFGASQSSPVPAALFSPDIYDFLVPSGAFGLPSYMDILMSGDEVVPVNYLYERMGLFNRDPCLRVNIVGKNAAYTTYWGKNTKGEVFYPVLTFELNPLE
jgi:hypothetical protein